MKTEAVVQGKTSAVPRHWPKWCGNVALFVCLLLGTTAGLRAQGVRYDNIVLGPRGTPIGAATIAVCSAGASTSTTPCSALANIYSDEALTQPVANPFQADSLGNYGFWAAPGHYIVQIYGTGVTTKTMDVFLPCDPSNCSMSSATFSTLTAGTINLTGALTVNGRNVSTEPKAGDAVMYVSPNGNDSADGLSWGSAKQTLYAAIETVEQTSKVGGTIYVAQDAACGGPVSGQGLWLYNTGTSPGTGWLAVNDGTNGHGLDVVGVGNGGWVQSQPAPAVNLNCGSATEPALQLENINIPLRFKNLVFSGSMGADIVSNVSTVVFDNVGFSVNDAVATNGPAALIGNSSFEIYFRHCAFIANDSASKTAGSDAAEALVVNPGTTSPNSDLIYVNESVTHNGDIKFYTSGTTGWGNGLQVNGLLAEGQTDGHGAVWFPVTSGGQISVTGSAVLLNVSVADATTNPTPALEVDGTAGTDQILAAGLNGYGVNAEGPATILSQYENNYQNLTALPVTQGEPGPIFGRTYYMTDAGRRLFGPTGLPDGIGPNLANFFPSQWENDGGNPTATTAPDGTNNAGEVVGQVRFYNSPITITNGDYIIGGVWARDLSTQNYTNSIQVQMAGCTATPTQIGLIPSSLSGAGYVGNTIRNPSEWDYWPFVFKLTGFTGSESCNLQFTGVASSTNNLDYYAPVLYHVAAGAITDNEAAMIGLNLASYPPGLSSPVVATLPGHPLAFGGSGDNYMATLDHTALTANRTYTFPDANGTVGFVLSGSAAGQTTAIPANSCGDEFTATVTGATTSMVAVAQSAATYPAAARGLTLYAAVTGTDTVTIGYCNSNSTSITPAAATVEIRVIE